MPWWNSRWSVLRLGALARPSARTPPSASAATAALALGAVRLYLLVLGFRRPVGPRFDQYLFDVQIDVVCGRLGVFRRGLRPWLGRLAPAPPAARAAIAVLALRGWLQQAG